MGTVKKHVAGVVMILAISLSLSGCGGDGGEEAPRNRPPSADAGVDQMVEAGGTVTLNGTGSSDPDGRIASYQWTQTGGPTVSLLNADQALASFVAPEVDATATFRLTVTDNDGETSYHDVMVTIQGPEPFVLDMSQLDDPNSRLQ